MVATYTANGRITKQGDNDNPNSWGDVLNSQVIELIEDMSVGVNVIDITGSSNVTLTTANGSTDQARAATLELTGVLGANIELLIPSVDWKYTVRCAWVGDYTVTIKISGSSTSIAMNTGQIYNCYTNGTDIYNTGFDSSTLGALASLDTVDTAQIENDAVTEEKLANDSITENKIADDAVTTNKINNGAVTSEKLASDVIPQGVPAGAVQWFAATTAPAGWLVCDGSAVSRTTYAGLFSVIGTTFGSGNNSTTFNLPDFRGQFIRGWDNGRGVDPGRSFGSNQLDAFQGHHHRGQSGFGDGIISRFNRGANGYFDNSTAVREPTSDGSNGSPRTADETRPVNVSLLAIIKT